MVSSRIKLIIAATALVLGAGGYFLYSVFAVQGQGTLAQAPLNDQVVIPPAFVMAVDDSGSMTFETLFPGDNGQAFWTGATASTNGFYDASGELNALLPAVFPAYAHVIPNGINIDQTNRVAIPPIDNFGFARSPEINPSYFDPEITYSPWLRANADGTITSFPDASITAALSDPRNGGSVQINMTSPRLDSTAAGRFYLRNGMVLPSGTSYYTTNNCGGLGRTPATRNTWVTLTDAHTVTATCRTSIGYFPATFYLRTTTPAPANYNTMAVPGRVLASNACGPSCDMWRYDITAANFGAAYPDMIQNFANWYSYYGNRNRAMVAGMTLSLSDVQNMRVGFFTINNRTTAVMRDMGIAADKAALYTSVIGLPASGGTPNLFAVEHLGEQFLRTDANAPVQLACQKNAGMLFTDGFSNSGTPGAPAVIGLGEPFDSTPADSLAAIATQYYQATLRSGPGFPGGQVPVPSGCAASPLDPRLDCRADPHMNFYGITLGVNGTEYVSGRDAFETPYPNWPGYTPDDPSAVDDIWHATVNTRGELISATTPADITAAMRRVLASVSSGDTPSGSIALTGSRIGADSLTVVPAYVAINNATDWYSTLTAATVTTDPITGVATFEEEWEASNELPGVAGRDIWFGRGSVAPVRFDATNVSLNDLCNNPRPGMSRCTASEIAALGGGTTLDEAIAHLKGEDDDEVTRGGDDKLRFRTKALGDIVNSTPVISAPTDDYGYRSLPAPYGGTEYLDYLTDKKNDRRPMVYAGANDGMLHAFDGRLEADGGGVERFAYIPQSVLGHMGNLLFPYDPADGGDQKFQHRYYVDGPVTVSDAYYSGAWETVLVGTTGAGARGAFALDVSDASLEAGGSFSAGDRLWEISDLNMDLDVDVRENIGHVLGRPVVVPVRTGSSTGPVKWRAIFGNGYNSVNGKAVLFLVDIDTNVLASGKITMIEAIESGAPAGSNGLGNVVVVDRFSGTDLTMRGRDGFADTVYAADQKGAIWKFDLRNADPADQDTPLFTTLTYASGPEEDTRQPILGGLTAASGPGGGVLVYFGTGSFSFNNDPGDTTLQSLYAVLDNGSGTTVTRSNLLQQTIVSTTTVDGRTFRTTSSNMMTTGRRGWYLDLPDSERFVGYPRIESGVVFMPTYAPNAASGCDAVGNNWLYGLNALTGGAGLSRVRFGSPTGDSPGPNTGAVALVGEAGKPVTAPIKDVAVLTAPRLPPLASGATPTELATALAVGCSMVVQVAGAPSMYLPRPCGRQSWRQIQ